jgi:predicted short-subunit dehydrogenase-like oxidoreductase (DUF2520 family)
VVGPVFKKMKTIVIIGAGRLGGALGQALFEAGLAVTAVADLSPAAARKVGRRFSGCRVTGDNVEAGRLGQALFLCVPDSAIGPAARELAKSDIDWRGKIVIHCSGLLDSRALDPLRRRGALTASSHPVQSFPGAPVPPRIFRGVSVGIEGQAAAVAWVRRLFIRLGAKPLPLRAEFKPLYHAACALASNDLVVLLDMALGLLCAAGFSRKRAWELLAPLVQRTLHNVNKLGAGAALTGPLVRGDAPVVARHLDALKKFPLTREAYVQLGLGALALMKRSGVRPEKIRALKRLLEDR